MPVAQYIPQTDPYSIPSGFKETTTPQGGTAYDDGSGNTYIRDANGFNLVTSLPGQLGTDASGQISPLPVPDTQYATTPGVLSSTNSEERYTGNLDSLAKLQGEPTPTDTALSGQSSTSQQTSANQNQTTSDTSGAF